LRLLKARSHGQPAAQLVLLGCVLVCGLGAASEVPPDSTPKEIEMGKEAAEQVAKRYKFVEDKDWQPRLEHMVQLLAPRSERALIKYQVKIIDDDAMNAFTLPGGYLYVTKELLKSARTDHEVAGVLAHEIAHNARMHVLKLLAKQRKLQLWQLLAVVGVAAGGSSGADLGRVGLMIIDAILNGYSQEAEREADEAAITYLVGGEYSPVGLLTFMELLRDKEERSPHVGDPGIYQTHPLTPERIRYLAERLTGLGIPLNRRLTVGGAVATAEKAPETGSGVRSRVTLGKTQLFELVDDPQLSRGTESAKRLNEALQANARMYSVEVRSVEGTPAVVWDGILLVKVTAEDAEAQGATQQELARKWAVGLKAAVWRESVASTR
jgi:hypothetical protein